MVPAQIPVFLPQNPSTENGEFRVVVLILAWFLCYYVACSRTANKGCWIVCARRSRTKATAFAGCSGSLTRCVAAVGQWYHSTSCRDIVVRESGPWYHCDTGASTSYPSAITVLTQLQCSSQCYPSGNPVVLVGVIIINTRWYVASRLCC